MIPQVFNGLVDVKEVRMRCLPRGVLRLALLSISSVILELRYMKWDAHSIHHIPTRFQR